MRRRHILPRSRIGSRFAAHHRLSWELADGSIELHMLDVLRVVEARLRHLVHFVNG